MQLLNHVDHPAQRSLVHEINELHRLQHQLQKMNRLLQILMVRSLHGCQHREELFDEHGDFLKFAFQQQHHGLAVFYTLFAGLDGLNEHPDRFFQQHGLIN
ncbi:hypothetical protein D3C75_468610 [compost metagenome]